MSIREKLLVLSLHRQEQYLVFLVMLTTCHGMAITVGWFDGLPLWSRLAYPDNYMMDCHEINVFQMMHPIDFGDHLTEQVDI